jgi:hypothetical protein
MESSFGQGIDPIPFIIGAYVLGTFLMLGYMLWTLLERRRLLRLLEAVAADKSL